MFGRLFPTTKPTNVAPPTGQEELVLYSSTRCPYCILVVGHIDLLGLDVPRADTAGDPQSRTTLQEKTGRTTVPCLFIDGEPLFESLDIMAWLTKYAAIKSGE